MPDTELTGSPDGEEEISTEETLEEGTETSEAEGEEPEKLTMMVSESELVPAPASSDSTGRPKREGGGGKGPPSPVDTAAATARAKAHAKALLKAHFVGPNRNKAPDIDVMMAEVLRNMRDGMPEKTEIIKAVFADVAAGRNAKDKAIFTAARMQAVMAGNVPLKETKEDENAKNLGCSPGVWMFWIFVGVGLLYFFGLPFIDRIRNKPPLPAVMQESQPSEAEKKTRYQINDPGRYGGLVPIGEPQPETPERPIR